MTSRTEMFAAAALAGLCSHPSALVTGSTNEHSADKLAARAQEIGEAMAARLDAPTDPGEYHPDSDRAPEASFLGAKGLDEDRLRAFLRAFLRDFLEEIATEPGAEG